VIGVLLLHLVVGVALLLAQHRAGRWLWAAAVAAPAVAVGWLVWHLPELLDGVVLNERVEWVPGLDLAVDLRVDGFAALMVAVVAVIGVGVFAYAHWYFDAPVPRLAGLLVLFCGAMLVVVTADNVLLLYGAWELTSVISFLLVGDRFRDAAARAAATKAILITGVGGLALLLGLIVLAEAAGTYRLSGILAAAPSGTAVDVALVLLAIGAFTKSAQYPFHAWLPGAMVAPTPVSAYLHSATMVKAGIYLVARFAPVFAVASPWWRWTVVIVGAWSMVAGGVRALREYDLKLVLAYGTISQLGFLMVLFGTGAASTTFAGCAVLVAHAVFKAALFMAVGIVDHGFGTRDVRALPHEAGPGWRALRIIAVIAAMSMAGVPLTLGFVAKEVAFDALAGTGLPGSWLVTVVVVAAGALTAGYSIRLAAGILGRLHDGATAPGGSRESHRPAVGFVAVPAVLAAVTVLWGVAPAAVDRLVGAAAASLVGADVSKHLAAWYGINLAVVLSGVALAGGVAVFALSRSGRWTGVRLPWLPSGDDLYGRSVDTLTTVAGRVTGIVQVGSMPVYLGVILGTLAVASLVALVSGGETPALPDWVDHPAQVPIVALLIGAAVGTAVLRHRLSVALLLGVVGYSMAGLFVVHGAPDLALTQAAVETLTTVLFVLTLRRLPTIFVRRSTTSTRTVRIVLSVLVGVMVFGLALAAGQEPLPRDVSEEMIARSVPDGNGRNVVNVILVDFRGLDTLGEISVVAVAAIGAVALARASAHGRAVRAAAIETVGPAEPLGPAGTGRHMFVDAVVRLLVYVALVVSVYLLVAGHNDPGGGFVGGLVAGAAVALRYVAGGITDVRSMVRAKPWTVLGAGLLLAAVTAAAPLLTGRPILDNGYWTLDPPLLGSIGVSSALAFDLGVYLVVVGLVFMAFEAFGDDRDGAAT
jgi:multicomponent Na+:H+ antiporter subunit A